ncbi:MAG: TolC family protein [Candidatus Cloacimonetes bacterium]|nr:TolC family protein [Candidatus Cloacimonadota bacterium]
MKRFTVLLLIATLAIGLFAEGYTLEQLIEEGMGNASSIRKSELNMDNANSSHNSSWLNFLPEAGVSYRKTESKDGDSESGSLSVSKTIALNEGDYFQFRGSEIDRSIAEISFDSAKKNLVYSILEAYLNILQTQKELEIQQENLALQERMYNEISLQVNQGRKTALDLNQTEIDKIDSQIQIDNLTNTLINLRADLFSMLKLDDNGSEFTDVNIPITPPENLPAPKELKPDNNDNPFNFKIDYLDLKKMKINEWQSKLNFLPTITVTASYGQGSVNDEVLEFKNYDESYSVQLNASYSLWNIFTHGEDYRRYKNSLKNAEIDLQDNIDEFYNQYNKYIRELGYLHKTKSLYERKASQSAENLAVANEKYTLGLIDLIELERARISNLQARISLNQNYYSILRSQEKLNQLLSAPIMNRW